MKTKSEIEADLKELDDVWPDIVIDECHSPEFKEFEAMIANRIKRVMMLGDIQAIKEEAQRFGIFSETKTFRQMREELRALYRNK